MPGNTQKILTKIWHHIWLKNDGEKWSRKNYFEIPRWPSEITANLSGQFSLSGQIFLHWIAATLKAIVEFWNDFLTTFSQSFSSQKCCQISVRIFCVLSGTRNLQWDCFASCAKIFQIYIKLKEMWLCKYVMYVKDTPSKSFFPLSYDICSMYTISYAHALPWLTSETKNRMEPKYFEVRIWISILQRSYQISYSNRFFKNWNREYLVISIAILKTAWWLPG